MEIKAVKSSARPRILFVAEAVTLAHVARPYVLASSLDPDRYQVSFASDNRFSSLFDFQQIANTHELHSIPSSDFLAALAAGRPIYQVETLRRYVQDDLALLEAVSPDVVVGDFRLSLSVSARLSSVPYVNVTNSYWSPFSAINHPIPEHAVVRLLGPSVAQMAFDVLKPTLFAWHARAMNRVIREYGISSKPRSLQQTYINADYVLYADYPGFVPMSPLPRSHAFLGPIPWSPRIPLPEWWQNLPTDNPIIYVTMGSSGPTHLLQIVLDALRELPLTVIASTAGHPLPKQKPSNAYLASYLPGAECVARAKLVLCNGGSPTTQQALSEGVPVLGIASNMDQYLNMIAVQNHHAGKLLRSEYARPQQVRSCVLEMLGTPKFHGAQSIAREFKKYDARTRFAAFLEHYLDKGRTGQKECTGVSQHK